MKKLTFLLAMMLLTFFGAAAYDFETSPWPLYESSKNVTITFNADQSSVNGLKNQNQLYAYIGVITNNSKNDDDWKYVKNSSWSANDVPLTKTATNKHVLSLGSGTLRQYFGITNSSEKITKIAVIIKLGGDTSTKTGNQYLAVEEETTPEVPSYEYSTAQTYPGGIPKQGAVKGANGDVTFCFAAPGKNAVVIKGSWNNYAGTLMKYQDYNGFRYFWTTVSGLDNSTWYPYYYLVDNQYQVADPYARLILEPKEDATIKAGAFDDRPAYPAGQTSRMGAYKGDIDDYNWEVTSFTPCDRSTLTIYEMLVRDFTGTNNAANGEGTFRKAMEKIPYLKDLGITAIELMPVMEFDYNTNWGYDTNSHFAVDKAYGSPNDMKAFVDLCHKNGIAVILDIVFNHVTDRHAWAAMYPKGQSPFLNATAPPQLQRPQRHQPDLRPRRALYI